jgi:hypothetical protein
MSTLLPGKKKAGTGKGLAPTPETFKVANLDKAAPKEWEQVNLKIPADKKLEMLFYGKERGMTLTKLLLKAFDEYKANHQ